MSARNRRLSTSKFRCIRLVVLGPLFSEADLMYNSLLVEPLDEIFDEVYLPQRNGGLLVKMIRRMSRKRALSIIHKKNMRGIRNGDVVLIVLDGRVPDEGAMVELGHAAEMGKYCIALQTTPIRLLPQGNNPMIEKDLDRPPFASRETLYKWARAYVRSNRKRRRVK